MKILVKDADLRKKLGAHAVRIMEESWGPKVVAARLVTFCNGLLDEEIIEFKDGPCSRTGIVSQNIIIKCVTLYIFKYSELCLKLYKVTPLKRRMIRG